MQCETEVSLEVSTLIHIFFLIIYLFIFYPISGDVSMSQSVETHTMTMAEN